MALAFWDYIRGRVRDAVLAGFNDAMEVVEGPDGKNRDFEAAQKLRARLDGTPGENPVPAIEEAPTASLGGLLTQPGQNGVSDAATHETAAEAPSLATPPVMSEPFANGSINGTTNGNDIHAANRVIPPRKRGRPRKDAP